MRLRDRRAFGKPEVVIIPMIDIMFFLLVLNVTYLVTVRKDGSLWLEDQPIDADTLVQQARMESQKNPRFAVVVRADGDMNYSGVMELLDRFRQAGITRFGLAAQ